MKLSLCLCAMVAVISTLALPVKAAETPQYKVEPFPTRCATIDNQEAYTSRFLRSMWKIEKVQQRHRRRQEQIGRRAGCPII